MFQVWEANLSWYVFVLIGCDLLNINDGVVSQITQHIEDTGIANEVVPWDDLSQDLRAYHAPKNYLSRVVMTLCFCGWFSFKRWLWRCAFNWHCCLSESFPIHDTWTQVLMRMLFDNQCACVQRRARNEKARETRDVREKIKQKRIKTMRVGWTVGYGDFVVILLCSWRWRCSQDGRVFVRQGYSPCLFCLDFWKISMSVSVFWLM